MEYVSPRRPTERSARYLYGDPRKGEAFVEWVRVHAFGASIVKPEPEDDNHKQRVIESIRALAPHDDLAVPEAVTKPEEQQSGSVVTAKARGPMRQYWMMRKEWDYGQLTKFGSHAGKPGTGDGVK